MTIGTHQGERALQALESRRFQVDSQQLDQQVALCERLSRCLRFVDLNNHEVGDWSTLFEADESLVMGRISSFDHYAWRLHFERVCDAHAPELVAMEIMTLARRLDDWHQALAISASVPATQVRQAIAQYVQRQLGEPLAAAVWQLGTRGKAFATGDDYSALTSAHRRLRADFWSRLAAEPPVGPAARSRRQLRQNLRALGMGFLGTIVRIQELARERLQTTLDSGVHEPAAGLLLAFLRLYGLVQQDVNGFAGRHIDFYYRRVLGLQQRPALPDFVHIACLADAGRSSPVEIAAGTVFNAGKDAAERPLQFRAQAELSLGDARVAALASLRQFRDPDLAPESSMAYVTGVKARGPALPAAEAEAQALFGGGPGSADARLGLAIASPLLRLKEGERTIRIDFRLAWPQPTALMIAANVAALEAATEAAIFRAVLGELFACWLLGDGTPLDEGQRATVLRRAGELGVSLGAAAARDEFTGIDPPSLLRMCSDEPDARQRVFSRVIDALFDVALTGAEGWLDIERVQFGLPLDGSAGGLRLRVLLRPEDPAIVGCDPKLHGAWPTALPLLRLLVSSRAGIHPASLFRVAEFVQAELAVDVRGVRDLMMHNQFGPLDPTKTFAPFGPLPTTASCLVLGSPEAACKSLDAMRLNLHWSGLPDEAGGWATHYAAYGKEQSEGGFAVALSLLRGGRWLPCGGASRQQPLFAATSGPDAVLRPGHAFAVDTISVREHAGAAAQPLTSTFTARDGLLRLQLNHPRGAFGHAVYPELLAQAVRQRSGKRRAAAMPNLPYTPELEWVSMDYRARASLPARPAVGSGDGERLLHLHPFGVLELEPEPNSRRATLLPALGPDGSLCIGLQAQALQGRLTLYFQLRASGAAELPADEEPGRLEWAYLAHDQWQPLDPRVVLADTTFGMLTSGIVTLDLPAGARNDNRLLGGGLFWLRVGSSRLLDTVSPLISVYAQCLTLERVFGSADGSGIEAVVALPAGRISGPDGSVPGLSGVRQPEPSSGLRPAEDGQQMRTRASERLRHKNRASLAWDCERIVLQHFPEVYKVACFPWHEVAEHLEATSRSASVVPGTVVVAVLPQVLRNQPAGATLAPRLDTLALLRIKKMLAGQVSPWVTLDVRNAAYERVQARCSVRLRPGAEPSAVRRRINAAITQYLSPWFDEGFGPRFDWVLRCEDVESCVRAVPGVAEVAGMSLLHVTHIDRRDYRLGDTAGPLPREGGRVLCHRQPWSLALPLSEHLIDFLPRLKGVEAEPSGYPLLRIGETFVVGRAAAVPLELPA